jgi:hypothetical protein
MPQQELAAESVQVIYQEYIKGKRLAQVTFARDAYERVK